ncbi:hypothetical protein [Shewanella violacea]|uniref:Uncharacterized protein n=1 Tax=Shewanella violacea (strain JCM 10179 / CIP 106290 / LMG 19151 / DSS12) TaxID=637905 RepID=D4ZJ54_SHEVD|nr:hypothetical protein [Shewanella violacea]BAJ01703.1 conserved hypothetical protein [Shewanella violacea DSS12]
MLTKILITALVIVGAFFYLRKPARLPAQTEIEAEGKSIMLRYIFMGLIAVSMLGSTGYWYWNWQDGNQVVTVTIVSPIKDSTSVYHVRKKDIFNNKLTTVEGIHIRLSDQDRVIIANSM